MGDLLKYVTELKEDGRITEQREQGSTILANWFDAVDSGCQETKIKENENILSKTLHV